MRTATVDVSVVHMGWAPDIVRIGRFAKRAVMESLAVAKPLGDAKPELCVIFAGDDIVRRLNRKHRGEDKPTNVLSFPQAAGSKNEAGRPQMLGDVVLAYETVEREAAAQGKSLTSHTSHLIVHGVLHLLGYDHVTGLGYRRMKGLEIKILARLGIADPYRKLARTR